MQIPSLQPTAWDLTRELWAVAQVVADKPTSYEDRLPKQGSSQLSWFTNVAYWRAYPDAPPVIDPVKDPAGVAAWNRLQQKIQQLQDAQAQQNQSPNYNPGKPSWPLATPPKMWAGGSSYGAKRPWNGAQTRKHTGIDLAAAPGAAVLAPEAGVVAEGDSGWEMKKGKDGVWRGVKALLLNTDSGLTLLLGGIRPGSGVKTGTRVAAGDKVAEIGVYPLGDSMLHFSLYQGKLSPSAVAARKEWKVADTAPDRLLDPADYLQTAFKNPKVQQQGAVQVPVNDNIEGGETDEGTIEGAGPPTDGPGGTPGNSKTAGLVVGGVIVGIIVAIAVATR